MKLHLQAAMDPVFYMQSPWFDGATLFPRQRKAVNTIYTIKKTRPLYEVIFGWGRRAGKTLMGSHFLSYGAYQLLQFADPQKRFGLSQNSPIELDAVAKSGKQTKRTVFKQFHARLDTNPYFKHLKERGYIEALTEEIRFPNEIYAYALNSNSGSSVGGTCWMIVFEELAKFDEGETTKSASENYTTLTAATSTLADFGAMSLVLSSIMHDEDIVMQLINKAKTSPTMYAELATTWDINLNLPFEGDYIQNKLRSSKEPADFWREYACIPDRRGKMYVVNEDVFKKDGITWNNLDINWLSYLREYIHEFPVKEFHGEKEPILNIDEAMKIPVRMKPDPIIANLPHVIAGDPAQTGDSFGLALGTLVQWDYFDNQTKDKVFYVDGLYGFEPDKKLIDLAKKGALHRKQVVQEGAISPNDVLALIMLARAHFNILAAVFDTWDYPMIQEKLMNAGIMVMRNTVKTEHYDGIKDRAHAGALRVVNFNDNEVFEYEMFKLFRKGNKVVKGKQYRKDKIDAMANCNWVIRELFETQTKRVEPVVVAVI